MARLNHFAFEYPTLTKLFDAHARLGALAIKPSIALNHGPTMSIYYQDPDQNTVELFYDNGYSEERLIEFFAAGHVLDGLPFDPTELSKDLADGKSIAELTAWSPLAGRAGT